MTDRHESVLLHFFVRTFLVPFIMLFALYVLVHGEASPGGGFQGGAIFAAALILARLSLGTDDDDPFFSRSVLVIMASMGVGIFTLTGIASVVSGGGFLDYGVIPLDWLSSIWPGDLGRRQMGIFFVEAGIAVAVFATLTLLFDYLTVSKPDEAEA